MLLHGYVVSIENKPCMYLQRGEGYSDFNEFAKAALNCYTIGKNAANRDALFSFLFLSLFSLYLVTSGHSCPVLLKKQNRFML